MDNSNNTNCCTPNAQENTQTNCCAPDANNTKKGKKTRSAFGLGILGLALILALTTAFKGSDGIKSSFAITENSNTPSKADFEWIKTDKKVVYIVLKGDDVSQNTKITSKVENLINELNETDGSAHFLALEANNPNYKDIVSKLKIEETPTIVVLGKSISIINEPEMNSAKLIRAYDAALTSKRSCSPAEKAACAEKNNTSYDSKAKASCTPKQKAACAGSKKSN